MNLSDEFLEINFFFTYMYLIFIYSSWKVFFLLKLAPFLLLLSLSHYQQLFFLQTSHRMFIYTQKILLSFHRRLCVWYMVWYGIVKCLRMGDE